MVMSVFSTWGPGLRGLQMMLPVSPLPLSSFLNAAQELWVCAFHWEREMEHGIRALLDWEAGEE